MLLLAPVLASCASAPMTKETGMHAPDFVRGEVRVTEHRGDDDLLSAGLGLGGLAGTQSTFASLSKPTAAELRRRALVVVEIENGAEQQILESQAEVKVTDDLPAIPSRSARRPRPESAWPPRARVAGWSGQVGGDLHCQRTQQVPDHEAQVEIQEGREECRGMAGFPEA